MSEPQKNPTLSESGILIINAKTSYDLDSGFIIKDFSDGSSIAYKWYEPFDGSPTTWSIKECNEHTIDEVLNHIKTKYE
jgi:hypothetical protein